MSKRTPESSAVACAGRCSSLVLALALAVFGPALGCGDDAEVGSPWRLPIAADRELAITEISPYLTSTSPQWIEVRNVGDAALTLQGCSVDEQRGDWKAWPLGGVAVVPAGGTLVIAAETCAGVPDQARCVPAPGLVLPFDGAHTLRVSCPDPKHPNQASVIDVASYDVDRWLVWPGRTLSLIEGSADPSAANDAPEAWCAARPSPGEPGACLGEEPVTAHCTPPSGTGQACRSYIDCLDESGCTGPDCLRGCYEEHFEPCEACLIRADEHCWRERCHTELSELLSCLVSAGCSCEQLDAEEECPGHASCGAETEALQECVVGLAPAGTVWTGIYSPYESCGWR